MSEDKTRELMVKLNSEMVGYDGPEQATALAYVCAVMVASQPNINDAYFKFNKALKKFLHEIEEAKIERGM